MKKTISLFLALLIALGTISATLLTVSAADNGAGSPVADTGSSADVWNGSVAKGFDGGTGTEGNPYIISTGAQLAYLAQSCNDYNDYAGMYFVLANDIDLNRIEWTPIGNGIEIYNGYIDPYEEEDPVEDYEYYEDEDDAAYMSFSGTFDGAGHIISGLKIDNKTLNHAGLFGYLSGATVKRLGVTNADVNIIYQNTVSGGAICGTAKESSIYECFSTGSVSVTDTAVVVPLCSKAGMIMGEALSTAISDCYAYGTVYSVKPDEWNAYAGGLAGSSGTSTMTNCYFNGQVKASGYESSYPAGLVGISGTYDYTASISNSFAVGTVIAENGSQYGGSIITESDFGDYDVTNCYYNLNFIGDYSVNGAYAELSSLQSKSWIASKLGWDFSSVWQMQDGEYPTLRVFGEGGFVNTVLCGDADGDGIVTIMDATRIQRFIAELCNIDGSAYMSPNLTDMQLKKVDVDQDSSVTIMDATAIQRWVAELDTQAKNIGKQVV